VTRQRPDSALAAIEDSWARLAGLRLRTSRVTPLALGAPNPTRSRARFRWTAAGLWMAGEPSLELDIGVDLTRGVHLGEVG